MKRKENKGITLIALVITVIVLLILAGVSISMLTGNNSIITKAGEAKTATDDASLVEKFTEVPVMSVLGSYENIKITTPEDLK